jgi:ketosteroid isomerase-like protein
MLSAKKLVVKQYCDAVGRGDIETVRSLVTDDYTHEFLGSTFLAGKRELPEVLERIKAFNAALVSGAKFTFQEMVEEGDLVLGIFTGECELRGGGRFDGIYAISCRFEGDRLVATRELVDTKLADSLLGQA